ncbi:MAG: hypothetical protein AAGC81_10235 [Pseudomonadota bacterium]
MTNLRLTAVFAVACVSIIFAAVVSPLASQAWSTPANQATIVAALLGMAGVVITGLGAFTLWLMQHQADRQAEKNAIDRRRQKLLIALRAELSLNAKAQFQFFAPNIAAENAKNFKAAVKLAKTGGLPKAVVSQTNDVYDHIKDEIADLPEEVIAPIINYYQQDEYVSELLKQITKGEFDDDPEEKRLRIIDALLAAGINALEAAIDAFAALDTSLKSEGVRDRRATVKMRDNIREMENELANHKPPDTEDQAATATTVKG